jgi:hypothetical protein
MILVIKLFLTPIFIALVSLTGRRWGSEASGWLMGLPLSSGPISFILALQYGTDFAARSAVGNLGGQVSVCVFCLAYSLAAGRFTWPVSAGLSVAAFMASTWLLNSLSLPLLPALALLLAVIFLFGRLIPDKALPIQTSTPPRWDLPLRMGMAALVVVVITTFANSIGAQLSGLIAPFPVFGVIMAAFTHAQQGGDQATRLVRGIVVGSLGFTIFFIVVAGLLPLIGILWTYLLAACGSIGLNAVLYAMQMKRRKAGPGALTAMGGD